jgi:hypothetical protein
MSLRAALRADLRSGTGRQRMALVGLVGWLAYEWGPGNETVTPWIVFRVLGDAQGDAATIAVPAVVGFGFTLVQQLASGLTALVAFGAFSRTADAAWRRLTAGEGTAPGEWTQLDWIPRSLLAFGLGTTAVALTQVITTGAADGAVHRRVVVQSAALCASLVAVLAALAGCLAWTGSRYPSTDPAVTTALRVLGNPLFWLGVVFGPWLVIQLARSRRSRRAT